MADRPSVGNFVRTSWYVHEPAEIICGTSAEFLGEAAREKVQEGLAFGECRVLKVSAGEAVALAARSRQRMLNLLRPLCRRRHP
jgi:hypothetical protein